MQEDAVEVSFCDLCGTSIPVGDLGSSRALRYQGKTLGACCLPALRGALGVGPGPAAGLAGPGQAAAGAHRGNHDGRLIAVAVVLLAAIAAATIFLDQKLSTADGQWRASHEHILQAQRSDGDVLQGIGVAMDGAARRLDVEAVATRVTDLVAAQQQRADELQKKFDGLQVDLAAVRQELRATASQIIDYRPLFEDLRQRQQRLGDAVQAAVAAPAAAPVAAPAAAAPAAAVGEQGAPPAAAALSEALSAQVKKLQSADPAVRFEAADFLLRSKDAAVMPFLVPLSRDADAYVRRLAVDGLRAWKHADVVEALLAALADADENVRDTAWSSLKEVTGQKLPFETTATKEARARAIQRWREWWDKNKASFGS
jgi:hypothetical protein